MQKGTLGVLATRSLSLFRLTPTLPMVNGLKPPMTERLLGSLAVDSPTLAADRDQRPQTADRDGGHQGHAGPERPVDPVADEGDAYEEGDRGEGNADGFRRPRGKKSSL